MIIRFTKSEQRELDELARGVTCMCERVRIECPTYSNAKRDQSKSNHELNWIGLVGECALAKALGVPFSTCDMAKLTSRPMTDNDVVAADGTTFQVKTTLLKSVHVLENKLFDFQFALEGTDRSEFKANFGVLAFIYPCKTIVNLAGYIGRREFLSLKYTVNFFGTVLACVPLSRMYPVEKLIDRFSVPPG